MPPVRPLPPSTIKELLEKRGYRLIGADDFNWAFQLGPEDEPVFVPIKVQLVPIEVGQDIARKVGYGAYFDAIAQAGDPFPPDDPRPASPPIRS